MRNAKSGRLWKEARLVVRIVNGRGGAAGKRYEVLLSSLPWTYQKLLIDRSEPSKIVEYYRPIPAANQGSIIERRLEMINEALDYPPGTPERTFELQRAAKKYRKTVRTLQRYCKELTDSGGDVNALAHKRPSNAGQRRVHVSRVFDKAFVEAGYLASELPELSNWIDGTIAAYWQSPSQRHGWWRVQLESQTALQMECEKRGCPLPKSACKLSRRRIMQSESQRIVDIYQNDRKLFDDMKPRIRRDNRTFQPMEQIVMDVKPLDCIVRRADGSETWPKLIGFMDTGTHRIFCHFVTLNKGEGIRQEHVLDGFLRMVSDPHWGFPQQVYRDNGSEYKMFDKIRSALAMIADEGIRTIINAKPYSGASKPIESKFAKLDRAVFSQMEGWAGGDRMNKKTQNVGKSTKPYSGSFDQFVQEALERIADFESWEIRSGPFAGVSPTQCYHDHLDNGWRPVNVDTLTLDAAFCEFSTRKVDRGVISYGGGRYRHPELPNRQTIPVAIPYRRGSYPLAKIPDHGWVATEPEILHLPGNISGAIETSRLQSKNEKAVKRSKQAAVNINAKATMARRIINIPSKAAPAPLIELSQSERARQLADARFDRETKRKAQPTVEERRIARQMEETERWEKARGPRSTKT
ncbi:transposase family protein [Sphingorhabdus sp. EL138]|uniref:integrase catalytic domain-containing protein n=1 Tax=Sphingorhabdus sp. EL138 TaxID=2073156 RepID=UPI0013A53713|nr:transposase family protein [Sphingorhabdus sp. EL138]